MYSEELINNVKELRKILHRNSYLINALTKLSDLSYEHEPSLTGLSQFNSKITKEIKLTKHSDLLYELVSIRKIFENNENLFNSYSNTLIRLIDDFISCHHKYIQDYRIDDGLKLILTANKLFGVLYGILSTIEGTYLKFEEKEYTINENNTELWLIMNPDMELPIVTLKLTAIVNIYRELCELLNINYLDYPLKIIKIETGSLWIRLFGETQIIKFIKEIFEKAIGYFHRNFTNEGKIEAIPKKIEVIEQTLHLRESLKKGGLKTEKLDQNIEKSAIILTENLNKLLQDQPVISIDGYQFSVGKTIEKKYIDASNKLFLNPKNESNSENT